MKKVALTIVSVIVFFSLSLIPIYAQDDHTAREEKEGKVIWEKLQEKKLTCDKLTDEDFERLGEYYMGQMFTPSGVEGVGGRHEAMNEMMIRMMGEKGESEMHVNLGKRYSGCDTTRGGGWPMMGYGGFNNMMGGAGGFGYFGFLFGLFWLVVLVDLILVGIWLWKRIKKEK